MATSDNEFLDIMDLLIEHGCQLDLQDTDGNTALMYAVPMYFTQKDTVESSAALKKCSASIGKGGIFMVE